jgi:hypothetical protein
LQEKAFFGHCWVSCLKMGMSKITNIICNIYSDPRTIVLKFQKYRSNRTCIIAKKLCVYRQKTTYPYHHTKVKNLQLYKNCLFGVTQRSLKHCDMWTIKQPTFYIYMYVHYVQPRKSKWTTTIVVTKCNTIHVSVVQFMSSHEYLNELRQRCYQIQHCLSSVVHFIVSIGTVFVIKYY